MLRFPGDSMSSTNGIVSEFKHETIVATSSKTNINVLQTPEEILHYQLLGIEKKLPGKI